MAACADHPQAEREDSVSVVASDVNPFFMWTRNRASTFDPNPYNSYCSYDCDDGDDPTKDFEDFARHLAAS